MKEACLRLGGLLQSAPTLLREKVIDTVTQLMLLQVLSVDCVWCQLDVCSVSVLLINHVSMTLTSDFNFKITVFFEIKYVKNGAS